MQCGKILVHLKLELMKRYLLVSLVMLSATVFAQFPPPQNFVYSYSYISLDDYGMCAGEMLEGPAYCSYFSWDEPDTTGTSASLDYYNIYITDLDYEDEIIIATTEISHEVEMGIIGHIWVTAVYSNPNGESEPSNIETNTDLPISLDEIKVPESDLVYYNRETQLIEKRNNKLVIKEIKIYNSNAKVLKQSRFELNKLSLIDLVEGVYILEIITDKKVFYQKILK